MDYFPRRGERGASLLGALVLALALGMGGVITLELAGGTPDAQFAAATAPAPKLATTNDCGDIQYIGAKSSESREKETQQVKQNCVAGCTYLVSPHLGTETGSGGKKGAGAKVTPVTKKPRAGDLQCKVFRCTKSLPAGTDPSNYTPGGFGLGSLRAFHNELGCVEVGAFNTKTPGFLPWNYSPNPSATNDLTNSLNKAVLDASSQQNSDLVAQLKENPGLARDLDKGTLTALNDALKAETCYTNSCTANNTRAQENVQEQLDKLAGETEKKNPTAAVCNEYDSRPCNVQLNPDVKQPAPYQGPCPDGTVVNPSTGTCAGKAPPAQEPPQTKPTPRASDIPPGPTRQDPETKGQNTFPKSGMPGGGSPGGGGAGAAPPQAPQQQPTAQCSAQYSCQNNAIYVTQPPTCQPQFVQQCQNGCTAGTATCSQTPQCLQPPAQPSPAECSSGTWKPQYGGANNACVIGWQCEKGGTTPPPPPSSDTPTAELSCQPDVADVGMTLSITYSCSAGTSKGSGFETAGATSGSTSTVLRTPPGSSNKATYSLTCTSEGKTGSDSCSIQVGKPAIVLVANPKNVEPGKTSALGWVTSGMKSDSCAISSPDLPAFTSKNAKNKSANGTAVTLPLPAKSKSGTSYTFTLKCETLGGATKEASAVVVAKEGASKESSKKK